MLLLGEQRESSELHISAFHAGPLLSDDCVDAIFDEHEFDVLGEYPKQHGGDVPLAPCDDDGLAQSAPLPSNDDAKLEVRSRHALSAEGTSTDNEGAFPEGVLLSENTAEFEFADDLVGSTAFEARRPLHSRV